MIKHNKKMCRGAATFNWAISNGAGRVVTILGSSGNLVNFQNADVNTPASFTSNPIPAGSNSFELWLQGYFSGVYTSIWNFMFWMNNTAAGTAGLYNQTGLTVLYNPARNQIGGYQTPVNSVSSIATLAVPSSQPGSANVSYLGSLTSSITLNPAYTDYIVMQLQVGAGATAGTTSLQQMNLSYIES